MGDDIIRSAKRWPSRLLYRCIGIVAALVLWQVVTSSRLMTAGFAASFSPASTFHELVKFLVGGAFLRHALPSLSRFGIGLSIALLAGIPVGILAGYFPRFDLATNAVFQFVRVTSPLAWMPVAIIFLGVGSKPVCFLIAVAAVWPIIINTVHGVRNVNPQWIRVVRMLGGGESAVIRHAVIPAILPEVLNGLRISVGVSWIVLVPAEMLGVSSGLGYYLLDTRDRFNYGELMAVILVIGFLGFLSDLLTRLCQRRFAWPVKGEEPLQE
jgi:NitT/TauT family transport system permease protein